MCALCLAALLALAVAPTWAAGAASLGGSALNNLTKGSSETETASTASTATTATTSTTESEPHNSHTTVLIVLGAAVLLLMGVAFVIIRDARRVAPAGDGELVEGSTSRHSEAALRRRRAKAKAARRQRKRNR